jgi:glycosyltransferase involved in cell wall biosynthesis
VLDQFRPEIFLTYGGHPVSRELMGRSRSKGAAVVFRLHNFAYNDRHVFEDVNAFIFPSEYSRRHYARGLGLEGTVISDPIRLDKVIAENPKPKYVINPQPDKGAAVFARIALELGRRRPNFPLLVVEGRGKADGLAGLPVDLSTLTNLNRMANTPYSRDFYRVSRVVLMPSLWRESLGRVPIEAMANGIPVLASDRGALPETLGEAGFVFTIPVRCTPASGVVPTAQEVAPWVAVIERLWDDPAFEAEHRRRGLAEARRWESETLAKQYEALFLSRCPHRA